MPKDIDEILSGMFRNGRLSVGSSPLERAKQNQARGESALDRINNAAAATGKNLAKSAEQLAREAQADLDAMKARLEKDGVETVSAKNAAPGEKTDAAFAAARKEAGDQVLGQEAFLDALTLALKRPFVVGSEETAPLGRIAVTGKPGTGRHTALAVLTASLGRQGVLKSPKLATLDLARYSEADGQKLFLQDLFSAVKSGACGIVFEHFEQAAPSVRVLLTELFGTGSCPLPGRYVEQKGILVDVGNALAAGAVSEISCAGRYLILLTTASQDAVTGTMGTAFTGSLDDWCQTGEFTPEGLLAIAEKELKELCDLAAKRLGVTLTVDGSAGAALAERYNAKLGAAALEAETGKLYKTLSEEKLQRGFAAAEATVLDDEGLCIRLKANQEEITLRVGAENGLAAKEAAVAAVKKELDEIVGLTEIKEYVLSLEDNFAIQQMRAERGLKAEAPSMHMIFTGNPGTGKTTVARLVARYLKAIGVLTGGQLVEVTRADLVGRYVGHTAPLTKQAMESALGGVLFIDEAYSLYRGQDDSFGLEAIDTLVKGMEDHRDQLVVILAGYTYEMEEFLTANSGLRSRFPNMIEFPDYTAQELLAITKSVVGGKGYRLSEDCDQPLLDFFEREQTMGDPRTNGNGRMARNKVEEAILNCSRRNLRAPEDQRDLELLLPEDFELN